jgi:hypothetical protein
MQLLNHVCLARQRTHQPKQQMNFHLGKSMNCSMRLGLSETTCPQRLREQNPVKVVFVLYDSEPSHSCSRLCPLFLLVEIKTPLYMTYPLSHRCGCSKTKNRYLAS